MIFEQTIEWAPFSQKHIDYIVHALDNVMNVAEGAVRSGKTIDHCIIAQMYLETCKDKVHLASGSTLANAKLNIGYCNGYGLECLFKGRCHWGKFRENEALYIDTKTGEKIVIFAGGGKADSYKKILGNSYGLWIATEINEHYDTDDAQTSFIKVAFDRQIASDKMLTLWDLNPSYPKHPIYVNYIDKWQEKGLVGGYQYQHFTIDDNLSVTEERKRQIESKYEVGSVWWKRNIKGMRVTAEGLIYPQFCNHQELFIKDKAIDEEGNLKQFMIITIGIDYGANKSSTAFKATGITPYFKEVWTLDEEKIEGINAPEQIYEKFEAFYKRVIQNYKVVHYAFGDYGSLGQVITLGINRYLKQKNIPLQIKDCIKGKITDRIQLDCQLFATGKRFILRKCKYMIESYSEAIWDKNHPDERLDDGTFDVDSLDAHEYSIFPFYDKLVTDIRGG